MIHALHPVPRIVVVGPASWNHLIELDRLPDPTPHMEFARRSVHTVGGTSAGKALHLAALGDHSELHCLIADDDDGHRIRNAPQRSGVAVRTHPSTTTERHVNLMTLAGERLSIYTDTPSQAGREALADIERALASADIAVLDLSDTGLTLLKRRSGAGWSARLWVDLHDYDGTSAYHQPFVSAADVVFMNDDRARDPWQLLTTCLSAGPRIAVWTLGERGAIAMDATGRRFSTDAEPTVVVDTNGAGDAFMAGFLHASLRGTDIAASLRYGAQQATVALRTPHLHPALTPALQAEPQSGGGTVQGQ